MIVVAIGGGVLVGAGAIAFGAQRIGSGNPSQSPTSGESATPAPAARSGSGTPDASPSAPPPVSASPSSSSASPPPTNSPGACQQGPGQRTVEEYLAGRTDDFGAVTVDGVQSAEDCTAIKAFQRRYGISPAAGYAGRLTADVARRLGASRRDACATGDGLMICVDLTHQTMWVTRGGVLVLGPTVLRTGRDGMETPTGRFRIQDKKRRPISTIYHVPMPYWQRIVGGIGFHETPSYLHEGPGSHGCLNLLRADAVALWGLTSIGTPVHVFGRKPGT